MMNPLLFTAMSVIASDDATSTASAGPVLKDSPGYFAGWGTLALINAGLAQGKNRSGLNWFLVSLLLGPVATFILVGFCEKLPEPTAKQGKSVAETDAGQ
jgi:hypothetical protein